MKHNSRLLGRVVSVQRPDYDRPHAADYRTADAALVIAVNEDGWIGILSFTDGQKRCVQAEICRPLRKDDATHYLHGLAVERFYTRRTDAEMEKING
jgi:hypothetical protein